jgi:hypothetical protein
VSDSPTPGPAKKAALGADLVLPALGVAFAFYFFHSVRDMAWEAKATAVVVGVTLLALIALLVVRVFLRVIAGEATLGLAPLIEPRRTQPRRLAVLALTGLFIAVIPWLGVTLGLFLLTGALMAVLGAGSWRRILATSAIIAASAYLLFIALLNSRLPRGPVEKLFAAMF